jgi:hypothetical protein
MVNTDSEQSSDHERSVTMIKNMLHTLDNHKESLPDIRELEAYYASDVWKKDFALDEAGILPKNLERGVLSEDGLYDLLEQNKEVMEIIASFSG